MKAIIYCRKCESDNVEYIGDNFLRCKNCKNEFDLYDGLIEPIKN